MKCASFYIMLMSSKLEQNRKTGRIVERTEEDDYTSPSESNPNSLSEVKQLLPA